MRIFDVPTTVSGTEFSRQSRFSRTSAVSLTLALSWPISENRFVSWLCTQKWPMIVSSTPWSGATVTAVAACTVWPVTVPL
jgi:hypothetical protein